MSVDHGAGRGREEVGADLAAVVCAEELDELREEDGDLMCFFFRIFDVFFFRVFF